MLPYLRPIGHRDFIVFVTLIRREIHVANFGV